MAARRESSCPLPDDRRVRPRVDLEIVDGTVGDHAGVVCVSSMERLLVNKVWSSVAESGNRAWVCPWCSSRWLLIPMEDVDVYHMGGRVLEIAHHPGGQVNRTAHHAGECEWCTVTWVAHDGDNDVPPFGPLDW